MEFSSNELTAIQSCLESNIKSYEERHAWAESLPDDYYDSTGCNKEHWVNAAKKQLEAVRSALDKVSE